jgi:hypothetical protein
MAGAKYSAITSKYRRTRIAYFRVVGRHKDVGYTLNMPGSFFGEALKI